jgi:hypothetical protein
MTGGRPNVEPNPAPVAPPPSGTRRAVDRHVLALLNAPPAGPIARLKTDLFREQAPYSPAAKRRLAAARAGGPDALRELEGGLGPVEDVEAGVLVDLLLSFRAVRAWEDMIRLVGHLPDPLRNAVLVREQYGFALNRAGRRDDAEAVLTRVIVEHGPSSETYSLLGGVYKDRWEADRSQDRPRAPVHLDQAIDAYRKGFEADWRDAYPGVNAATLMEIRDPGAAPQRELVPVVGYACRRRIEAGEADYWDHATRIELGVLARDADEAYTGVRSALTAVRERWEPESTAYNLSLIRESRAERGQALSWADEIEFELRRASASST